MREVKTKSYHYFVDEKGLRQGKYKRYHYNDKLWIHSFYKDGKLQGKYKEYNEDGSLKYTKYFSNDKNVTDMFNKLQTWKSL